MPRLTPAQDEALDMLAAVCDEPGPGRDCLLLRLWLAPPNSRPLPAGFEALWGSVKGGKVRGGIAQPAAPTRA